jgi:type VI protein secretion system component VasF
MMHMMQNTTKPAKNTKTKQSNNPAIKQSNQQLKQQEINKNTIKQATYVLMQEASK